jgi:general nucleoside transport system ATP-binding protein
VALCCLPLLDRINLSMQIELRNIHKSFGPVKANVGINFHIPSGTIQGILGENGAGKSTLMKILSGFIHADQGEILLNDKPVVINSPADAIKYGIGMLHQDPLDFPPMSVIDNFLIGQTGGLFPNRRRAHRDIKRLQKQFDFNIHPYAYIDTLTVGERQQIEILRLLWLGAQVLILDEPTTGISAIQKEKLFAALRKLAEQNKTIIFVSHKLEDVEVLCDRVAVLRQGELVGEALPPYSEEKLVEMMFNKVVTLGERYDIPHGSQTLVLNNVGIEDYRLKIENVNQELRAGEVIGLAGMEGSGQSLLLKACAGLLRPVEGKVVVCGKDLTGKNYHKFADNGVAYLPASRLEEGLVPGLTLTEHFILSDDTKGVFINWEKGRKVAMGKILEFNIRGATSSRVESLSGGNQQRALLSLLRTPLTLVLLEHPTRGLDIESAIYIWSKLKERCRDGTSIFFISSDLEEILQYSDRVLVFYNGQVSPPLDAATTSVDQLGQLIGGKGWSNLITTHEIQHAEA